MSGDNGSIIIRRVRKVSAGGHHGGAWKVAYADFVTAMMAFFLVMWLVGSTTNKEKAAISEYFKNPSAIPGHSASPAPGPNGPGGASTSMIKLGGTMELPHGEGVDQFHPEKVPPKEEGKKPPPGHAANQDAEGEAEAEADHKRLESLLDDLKEALGKSQALEPFKDQLLLDIMAEGLRIQIVDKQNRPMFDLGAANLKPYTVAILKELARFINAVPNRISIAGHTDVKPFPGNDGYTNWELSSDRANAARRALVAGGMDPDKIVRVVGLASSVLFDKADPYNPINRRISIIVMTRDAEMQALGEGVDKAVGGGVVAPGGAAAAEPTDAAPASANGAADATGASPAPVAAAGEPVAATDAAAAAH
jgi:chemotaxis protein MotB